MSCKTTRHFTFEVSLTTQPDEHVCLTGSIEELGNWDHKKGIILHPKAPSPNHEGYNVWSTELIITGKTTFSYSYYVCNIVSTPCNQNVDSFIVTRWEANLTQRTWHHSDGSSQHVRFCDQFGIIDGTSCSNSGWLTVQTDLKLTILPQSIQLHQNDLKLTSVKCVPLEMSLPEDSALPQTNLLWSKDACYVLTEENYQSTKQSNFGCVYEPDSVLTFKSQVLDSSKIGFRLDFYGCHTSVENNPLTHGPTHIGYSYILPSILKDSLGTATTYISTLDQKIAGEIKVKYCITKPLQGHHCSLEFSYQKQLQHQKDPLHIGHRGMGSSFTLPNPLMENTIASFCAAGHYGADFVEMDVHLTKDHVPVIYHDFSIDIAMEQKDPMTLLDNHTKMSIKNLTLNQLQSLKLFYRLKEPDYWMPITKTNGDPDQPFPTLEKCLEEVPEEIGFNVEIKYPLECIDDTMESEDIFDANFFLDVILAKIFKHSGKRKIILSTFEPDLCCMLHLKQNKYPVLFLTQGINSHWVSYKDARCHTTSTAISFAKAESLTGICAHAEELLKDTELMEMCVRENLSLIAWGNDIENYDNMKVLTDYPLTGLIYNRMDVYGPASVLKIV
ncbi:glycerophosphocholine phosphodiesterase GPCPD1 isoform X1 [Octopus bimaculoides]|uniref:GP-PDE domain-containing protein n=1 Tax=Octopus bimaculoides TaxID=37653 RepID=A0A0L8G567_OCTBM|nr:glycerophosphocholine phosphodiesterase GPCPD1 isoform X1 [Octopus bimaculoides]XP_052829166.1 glycerophosphocholine phosphodiesterase GPCPD1 isoform X1 [Octopus bimaculoides]XP_052829170.1 glycerophosphocholine phosphodiesterase GPCPD1 isoform X1 [Octopus bimaculoides]|eukprot:XP_014784314.1 PREDICTED: glycerophosphocholine phosphodiesterase GPCPD1-like [Octopus bimaculoides]